MGEDGNPYSTRRWEESGYGGFIVLLLELKIALSL